MRRALVALAWLFQWLPLGLHRWIWQGSDLWPGILGTGLRYALARAKAASLGDNVYFGRNVTVKNWSNLRIGDNVSIHENCFVDALGGITIGSNVSIAHGASLIAFDHRPVADLPIKYGPLLPGPIHIGDDVWIAAGVRVLKGTFIGPRSILAANSVARGTLAGGWIHGGLPARMIKPLNDADQTEPDGNSSANT